MLPPLSVAVVTEDGDAFVVTFPTPQTGKVRGDFNARILEAAGRF